MTITNNDNNKNNKDNDIINTKEIIMAIILLSIMLCLLIGLFPPLPIHIEI